MISKPRNLEGETKVNVAHTGVMIQGSRILAESLYDRLNSLKPTNHPESWGILKHSSWVGHKWWRSLLE